MFLNNSVIFVAYKLLSLFYYILNIPKLGLQKHCVESERAAWYQA
jgi:hypothetical protein